MVHEQLRSDCQDTQSASHSLIPAIIAILLQCTVLLYSWQATAATLMTRVQAGQPRHSGCGDISKQAVEQRMPCSFLTIAMLGDATTASTAVRSRLAKGVHWISGLPCDSPIWMYVSSI